MSRPRPLRLAGAVLGAALLAWSIWYLAGTVDAGVLARAASALVADPLTLGAALCCYAGAFGLRTLAWTSVLPSLSAGQAWAALHVSLAGNHVLPLRLGEPLRVTSVLRRTPLPIAAVTASALLLRAGDLVAVLLLALLFVPSLFPAMGGAGAGPLLLLSLAVAVGGLLVSWCWLSRLRRRQPTGAGALRRPGATVVAATLAAWCLEAVVLWSVAVATGVRLGPYEALGVTAVTIAAQALAVTPGGVGSYEAAATAALVALGVPPPEAFAVALATHAVKTVYALGVGGLALVVPAPGYWGPARLPRRLPPRPEPYGVAPGAPVVALVPVHDEEATVGEVIRRLPDRVEDRPVVALVVDDGSTDASTARAATAGARVVAHPSNRGLGAAVRRGLAEAVALRPAAVVYLDADLEYDPAELGRLAAPVLAGDADYVVGSRFAGQIRAMRLHRRLGNRGLTVWVRWLTRRGDLSDGQSGYRAFSPRAAAEAEIIHDYNYAQVLTLDLLAKGFRYAEVPICYGFRRQGRSFVRLGSYLRRVLPAVRRELAAPSVLRFPQPPGGSGTTEGTPAVKSGDTALESTTAR